MALVVVGHRAALDRGVLMKRAVGHRRAANVVVHPPALERDHVPAEPAVRHRRVAAVLVVHPAAVRRRVVAEDAVGDLGVAVHVIDHAAAFAERFVLGERAVGHRRAAVLAIVHPATIVRGVLGERAVRHRRATGVVVHAAAAGCRAAGDGEAVQDRVRPLAVDAPDHAGVQAGGVDRGHLGPVAAAQRDRPAPKVDGLIVRSGIDHNLIAIAGRVDCILNTAERIARGPRTDVRARIVVDEDRFSAGHRGLLALVGPHVHDGRVATGARVLPAVVHALVVHKAVRPGEVRGHALRDSFVVPRVDARGLATEPEVAVGRVKEAGVLIDVARAGVAALHVAVAYGRVSVIVVDLAKDRGRIAPENAVSQRRVTVIVAYSAAVSGGSLVPAESAVGHRRTGAIVVHAATVEARVPAEGAVGHHRGAARIVAHPATTPTAAVKVC